MTPLRLLLLAALALGLSGCAKLTIKRDGSKAGTCLSRAADAVPTLMH